MHKMEQSKNQIPKELTQDITVQLFVSKTVFDYAYGQVKLSGETSPITGAKFSREYRFTKGFTDLPTYTMFHGKTDRTLEYSTQA